MSAKVDRTAGIDRREMLWLGLASLAAAACGGRAAPPELALPVRRHLAEARLVGEGWLGTLSPRPTAEELARELAEGAEAPEDAEAFARHLRRRHRDDLLAGRTERVQGWLLSRTEAALYALLALQPG